MKEEPKEPKKKVKRYVSQAHKKEIERNTNTDKAWGSFNPTIPKTNR